MMVTSLIVFLQNLNPYMLLIGQFVICMFCIVVFNKWFGKEGLCTYSVVAIIIANIQILRATTIPGFNNPVPLGDVVFVSIFLVINIISEIYSHDAAYKIIWHGVIGFCIFIILVLTTISVHPLSINGIVNSRFIASQEALEVLFIPSLSILVASLIAYAASFKLNVMLFGILRNITKGRFVGLRHLIASTLGIIFDSTVFGLLAWIFTIATPLSYDASLQSYMVNTAIMRILFTMASIPVFYYIILYCKRVT